MLRAMPTTRPSPRLTAGVVLAGLLVAAGCARKGGCTGDYCGTLVIAAAGEPDILLPPVSEFAITRDVTEQLFLKLADLGLSGNTIGDEDFQPLLAERWEWDTPTTLVFHLDPRARWQDGHAVTAADVAFTYDIYTDSLVSSPFRSSLRQIAAVTTRDSLTVVFRFRHRYPEMFYDAVYHLRILPSHLLREVPRSQWRSAAFGRAPVGDGPYRFVAWRAGESLELAADSTFFLGRPHLRRLIWRFTADQQVAVTQLVAGDADAVEVLVTPDNRDRALAHDSARAARSLTRLGWVDSDGDGIRDRDGHPLAFRLLVPTTSAVRRQYARFLQEQFRTAGIDVQLEEVDFSVFNERARAGRFDALINVWNTDPTPSSGIPESWTQAGFGRSNYGRYENPAFERLLDRAVASASSRDEAKRTWRAAIELLNQDAPAIFLFATENYAAAHKRIVDRPLWVQYVKYLGALLRGDLGESLSLHRPVADALADALPNTFMLALTALILDFALGLALGVYQAVRERRSGDIALGNAALFVNSMPTFWLGLVLLLVFGQRLGWFPVGGLRDLVLCPRVDSLPCAADFAWHLALPALTLGLVGAASTARYQRAAPLDVVRQDFVRTARAKGLPERRVLLVHALRNALLPLITLFGLTFPFLLTGAVLVETLFSWPGMGLLAVNAILQRDYPIVTAAALVASVMVVLGNLLADALYGVADPRIRVRAT